MDIEIGTDLNSIPLQPPHFWRTHTRHEKTIGTETAYEIPLDEIARYIASQPDTPLLRESLQRLLGSHGLHVQFDAIYAGAQEPARAFVLATDEQGNHNPLWRGDWLQAHPGVLAVLVGNTQGHTRPDHRAEIDEIRAHQVEIAKLIGLTPNVERLQKELCTNCK